MNYSIIAKPSFQREAKRMAKHYRSFKSDYAKLLDDLEANPRLGIDLGGGLRKIRMAIASKGEGQKRRCKGDYLHGDCVGGRNRNKPAVHIRQGRTAGNLKRGD